MPNPTYETVDLSVCVDCRMFFANGDLPESYDPEETPDDADWHPAHIHGEDGYYPSALGWTLIAEWGEKEEHSIYDCETCGSRWHGERYPATAMRPAMQVEVHYSDDCWNEDGEHVNPWCDDTIDPATIAQTVTLICRNGARADDDQCVLGSSWEILEDNFAYTVVSEFKADQICTELRADGYAVTEDPNTVPFHS